MHRCHTMSTAKKTVTIYLASQIFALHLKRFTSHAQLTNVVDNPEMLDINPYLSPGASVVPKYALIATIRHEGDSKASGHYTPNCKSSAGTWNLFNDTEVYLQSKRYLTVGHGDNKR